MEQRKLGQSDLMVSPLGLGCSLMSGGYGKRDDAASTAVIRRALDLGIRYFDTSDAYGNGHNEQLLASALGADKSRVVIGTKFGNLRGDDGQYKGVDGRPERVAGCCEDSLKRLGLEVIDLYYLLRIDPDVPIEETVGAMAKLVEAGKVRAIGICEASAETVRRAHGVHPLAALQIEYSLWTRDIEAETLPTCRELGISVVAYAPLGRGFLSGTIRGPEDMGDGDRRGGFPRYKEENLKKNLALLPVLDELAAEKNCHPANVALAWVAAQGEDILPICGTMKVEHLESNLAALDLPLTEADMARLDAVFRPGVTAGNRYPDHRMHLVGA